MTNSAAIIEDKPILEDLHRRLHKVFPGEVADVFYIGRFYEGRNPEEDYYPEFVIVWKGGAIDRVKKQTIHAQCYETDLQFNEVSYLHIISEEELKGIRGQTFPYNELNEIGVRVEQ